MRHVLTFESVLQLSYQPQTDFWLQNFCTTVASGKLSTTNNALGPLGSPSIVSNLHGVLCHIVQVLLGQERLLPAASHLVVWLCHPPEKLLQSKY